MCKQWLSPESSGALTSHRLNKREQQKHMGTQAREAESKSLEYKIKQTTNCQGLTSFSKIPRGSKLILTISHFTPADLVSLSQLYLPATAVSSKLPLFRASAPPRSCPPAETVTEPATGEHSCPLPQAHMYVSHPHNLLSPRRGYAYNSKANRLDHTEP